MAKQVEDNLKKKEKKEKKEEKKVETKINKPQAKNIH